MQRFVFSLVIIVNLTAGVHAGEKAPAPADVRKAVARSLPFVEKDGLAWIDKRNCMSCHVVTFMLWAHNEAHAQGIGVDRKKVAEWNKWSMAKSIDARVFFKVNDKVVQSLPAAVRPKLTPLVGEGFQYDKELMVAVSKALTAEEWKEHQAAILKQSALPKGAANDGGGLDTLAQLFLGRPREEAGANADFFAGAADLMVRMQEADGSWRAGGQLPARKWSKATANQTSTLWALLALTTYDQPTPTIQKSIVRAHAAVKKPAGDGNLEWIVARLLYDDRFGTPDQKAALKEQLLNRQNTDGGWSALPKGKSEAFSTGQSLYALRVVGMSETDAVIGRAQKYLLDTQNPDGSWTVDPALTSNGGPPRLKKLEPIWRNWGTSWAAIGLSRSLAAK